MHQLIENADTVFCLDNEALYNTCVNKFKLKAPTYDDLNHLATQALVGATCSYRFAGQLNHDMRSLGMNMSPFPRLHFLSTSCAPLVGREITNCKHLTIPELTQNVFDENFSCANPKLGKYLAASILYRGKVSFREVEDLMYTVQNKNSKYFVEWIPNNVKYAICP